MFARTSDAEEVLVRVTDYTFESCILTAEIRSAR